MEPLALDPTDPLSSVLRWLAALAQALGIDRAQPASSIQLDNASARVVRRVLADWSRQLRAVIRNQAVHLLPTLHPQRSARGETSRAAPSAAPRSGAAAGRFVTLAPTRRRMRIPKRTARAADRRAPEELLDPCKDAALRRRTRAVLAALLDPSDAVRRLARRLARATRAEAPNRPRIPRPPRSLGGAPRGLVHSPEPRPPNGRVRSSGMQQRPAAPAAAASALAVSGRIPTAAGLAGSRR